MTLLDQAKKYMAAAVSARERFFQGLREAETDFHSHRTTAGSVADAKYRATQMPQMKVLIDDNRWHMQQSQMFSTLFTAEAMALLVAQQKETNRLLTNIDRQLDAMHNSIKEMKVY